MRSKHRNTLNAEVKEYLMSVIGSAPYGLIAIDLAGMITIANDLAAIYLGGERGPAALIDRGPAGLIDRPILEVIVGLPPFYEVVLGCLEKGRKPFDLDHLPLGGRFLCIHGRLILNGLLVTIEDVTRQVKAEEAMKVQARQLAAYNKELEEFAWLSSHDMKSPILSLDGLLAMMEKRGAVKPEFQHLFELVRSSSQQMRKTILALNQIIAFRKTLHLEPERVDFESVWEEVTIGVQESILVSGARVCVDFSAASSVLFPPVHLKSILQNLLTNAIKYKQPDAPPVVAVKTFLKKGDVVLAFRDEGMGMDLSLYRKKLFGLFQRFHPAIDGMGIGLHMIHSIVKSYGGHVEVQSKVNQGTTFKIYFRDETIK